jgi:hypothetical protein
MAKRVFRTSFLVFFFFFLETSEIVLSADMISLFVPTAKASNMGVLRPPRLATDDRFVNRHPSEILELLPGVLFVLKDDGYAIDRAPTDPRYLAIASMLIRVDKTRALPAKALARVFFVSKKPVSTVPVLPQSRHFTTGIGASMRMMSRLPAGTPLKIHFSHLTVLTRVEWQNGHGMAASPSSTLKMTVSYHEHTLFRAPVDKDTALGYDMGRRLTQRIPPSHKTVPFMP